MNFFFFLGTLKKIKKKKKFLIHTFKFKFLIFHNFNSQNILHLIRILPFRELLIIIPSLFLKF